VTAPVAGVLTALPVPVGGQADAGTVAAVVDSAEEGGAV
jgi:pyruvate/2-oxoglutarate dehydrogenase complex dihydrolipoamide acyltransferase (E2) component